MACIRYVLHSFTTHDFVEDLRFLFIAKFVDDEKLSGFFFFCDKNKSLKIKFNIIIVYFGFWGFYPCTSIKIFALLDNKLSIYLMQNFGLFTYLMSGYKNVRTANKTQLKRQC